MLRLKRLLLAGASVALLASLIVPVVAQEAPAPGEGGILIEGNFGGDPATMNPILASDTASQRVYSLMFPGLIGANPETAEFVMDDPTAPALVNGWTISEDGLVYTLTLRQDWTWTDGTPMTTADVIYTWNAIVASLEGTVDSPLGFITDQIESVEATDDFTLVVTMKNNSCTALSNIASIYPVPSHVLPADLAELNNADFNLNPSVTGGSFTFGEFRAGEQVGLQANPNPPDGNPTLSTGWIYRVVPDQTVLVEQFLAGETNVIDGPPVTRRAEIEAMGAAGDANVYPFPGNAWDYLALNQADATNPQPATDEAGNPIDQGNHPLFGDVRVRQAIARAIDVDSIINGAVAGYGSRMTSAIIPASWAYAQDLPPIGFNPEEALAILAEAGWVDDDNDPATPLVADGAMYAEDGTPFRFTLYTNEGNSRRGAVGTLIQDQLSQIGIEVDFQAIDFNTLIELLDSQTFDAVVLGWRNGWPDDPDVTQLFTPVGDVPGNGSNYTSYNNPRVIELNEQARALPGCDQAARAELYAEMQAIMQEDLPYIWLYAIDGMYASAGDVQGFGPFPSNLYWNVQSWFLNTP
jgi:peptide/nickel transport system substrate-binding protein